MDSMDELRSPSRPTSPAAPIIVFPSPSMLSVLQLLGTIRCPEKPRAAHPHGQHLGHARRHGARLPLRLLLGGAPSRPCRKLTPTPNNPISTTRTARHEPAIRVVEGRGARLRTKLDPSIKARLMSGPATPCPSRGANTTSAQLAAITPTARLR